jgi:acyl carrier protein
MTSAVMENEIKLLIIESLFLEDIKPEDIKNDEALFGDGLGLDSIDALELGIALQRKYGIIIKEGDEENRQHFASVNSLSEFVKNQILNKQTNG